MFKLEDFIDDYPEQNDPLIQDKLTNKRELNELAPNISERLLKRGDLYKHQKLFFRIFKNYPRSLILDRTGTGKTCEIISIAEYFKNIESQGKSPLDEFPHIRRILFLVKGPNLEYELRNQLVFKCTPEGTYDTFDIVNAKETRQRDNLITREIKEWYEINTFEAFANNLFKLSDAELIKSYSGTMIFIDEAQFLKSDSTNITADLEAERKKYQKFLENRTSKKQLFRPDVYNQIWRLTHLALRTQVYMATASPMINDPSEIVSKINLLLPANNQMDYRIDWNKVTKSELEPYFRGLISFVRELDTGIKITHVGKTNNVYYNTVEGEIKSQTVIYNTVMSKFQETSYERARTATNTSKTELTDSFYWNELSASNFVFPDGSWGGDFERKVKESNEEFKLTKVQLEREARGISNYVTLVRQDEYEPTELFEDYLSDINNIQKSSSKYADIVKRYSPNFGNKRGKAFIYSKMKSGSGLYILAMCLQAHGFERYSTTPAPLVLGKVKEDFPKKPRLAIITGSTQEAKRKAIMDLFNSYDNRNGDYIQILIGSEVTQAGINLNDVVNFEFASSGWHMSGLYQALSRILRATSHENLIREAKGIVNIDVFLHCAQTAAQYNNFLNKSYNYSEITAPGDLSTDDYSYLVSEDKDIRIKRVEHILVLCSVNYYINFYRNHRKEDKDYTQICFYQKCDTTPEIKVTPLNAENYWDTLNTSDTSTYDLYYTAEIIEYFKNLLTEVFRKVDYIHINDLEIGVIPKRYVIISLNKLSNTTFYNYLGIPLYLKFINDILFLDKNYETSNFDTTLLLALNTNFHAYLLKSDTSIDSKINEILKLKDEKSIIRELKNLPVQIKANLLEVSINKLYMGTVSIAETSIYNYYKSRIFVFNKPIGALAILYNIYERLRASNHKNYKAEFDKSLLNIDFNSTDGSKVIIHILYCTEFNDKYRNSTNYRKVIGELRVFDVNNLQWIQQLTPYEDWVYHYMCNYTVYNKLQEYESKSQIYGVISYDDTFSIRDTTKASDRLRLCTNVEDLPDKLYKAKFNYDMLTIKNDKDIEDMLDSLATKSTESFFNPDGTANIEKILYYYNLFEARLDKPKLCTQFEQYLIDSDLVFDLNESDYTTPIRIQNIKDLY